MLFFDLLFATEKLLKENGYSTTKEKWVGCFVVVTRIPSFKLKHYDREIKFIKDPGECSLK
jgi:hypothetical protein